MIRQRGMLLGRTTDAVCRPGQNERRSDTSRDNKAEAEIMGVDPVQGAQLEERPLARCQFLVARMQIEQGQCSRKDLCWISMSCRR